MAKKKRKRKLKREKDSGIVIRVSNVVLDELNKRKGEEKMSFDALLRKILALKSRRGDKPTQEVYWVLPKALEVARTVTEARGKAVVNAVTQGKGKAEKPIKVVRQ